MLFHQPHDWGPQGPGIEPFSAVRVGDWKLIWFHDVAGGSTTGKARVELYDLRRDLCESNDLAERELHQRNTMSDALRSALLETGAQRSRERLSGKPVEF
jgi:hypothetical protein